MPKNGEFFIFPIADGTVQLSGGDHGIRNSTPIQDYLARGEKHNDDLQEGVGRFSTINTLTDDSEARNKFWTIAGNYIHRHLVEPRVKLHGPNEESFLDYLKAEARPRKPHEKSWSCPWNQRCLARFKTTSTGNFVAENPTLADLNMHASPKLTNLRGSAWERLIQRS